MQSQSIVMEDILIAAFGNDVQIVVRGNEHVETALIYGVSVKDFTILVLIEYGSRRAAHAAGNT
jgi:hypothetical protein